MSVENDAFYDKPRVLYVRFETKEDMDEFSKLIGVPLSKKIKKFTYCRRLNDE